MNGIHDMGGMHGFGKVEAEANEPVFHARWEARVFGIALSLGTNIDAFRHALEKLDPVTYLKDGYYGRWLAALQRSLIDSGVLAPGDVEQQAARGGVRQRREPVKNAPSWKPPARGYVRAVSVRPAFSVGQKVLCKNHQPPGHTRLPGYGRCHRGVICRVHPAMVFPDDHAHGRGENPQYLYTVRFEARELWGSGAEPGTAVHIDLFESYLQSREESGGKP
jgi:nitrile hydratase